MQNINTIQNGKTIGNANPNSPEGEEQGERDQNEVLEQRLQETLRVA
jgi:hypothetical protein